MAVSASVLQLFAMFCNKNVLIRQSSHLCVGFPMSLSMWCYNDIIALKSDGSLDRSLIVDQLSCFSLQPMLHNWCNNDHDMYYPVSGMAHYKRSIGNSSPCRSGIWFPLSLSKPSLTICLMPYYCKIISSFPSLILFSRLVYDNY